MTAAENDFILATVEAMLLIEHRTALTMFGGSDENHAAFCALVDARLRLHHSLIDALYKVEEPGGYPAPSFLPHKKRR